jgi:hypothetical protein
MASCPDTGAAILAELWNARPTDMNVKGFLISASRGLNDRRIVQALVNVISDPRADSLLRIHAINAMASQLEPILFLALGTMVEVPGTRIQASSGSVMTVQSYKPGREEPTPAFLAATERELRLVAERDSVLGPRIRDMLGVVEQTRKRQGRGGLSQSRRDSVPRALGRVHWAACNCCPVLPW